MRLLLIRHGETVDNVAQIYAGSRDSPLTSHGVLQASRLGSYLTSSHVRISQIFSSDLQRACKTAEAIRLAQASPLPESTELKILREQDFGSLEGKPFAERSRGGGKRGRDGNDAGIESQEAMVRRMETFIDLHLVEVFQKGADEDTVAVVAHGNILVFLWRCILRRFDPRNVQLAPSVVGADRGMGLQYLGGWSNTGYMDLEIRRKPLLVQALGTSASELQPSPAIPVSLQTRDTQGTPVSLPQADFHHLSLIVKAVNCKDHLRDLKKTRGGIGSLKHDDKQTTMDSFFKKRKIG